MPLPSPVARAVVPFAPSYDTVGWFARDAELLADVGAALLPRNDIAPITKLVLARDAFALVDATLAPEAALFTRRLENERDRPPLVGVDGFQQEQFRVIDNPHADILQLRHQSGMPLNEIPERLALHVARPRDNNPAVQTVDSTQARRAQPGLCLPRRERSGEAAVG